MVSRHRLLLAVPVCIVLLVASGCGDNASADAAAADEVKAEANVISGKVTMGDGSPLRGEIKDLSISIVGVSEAAEKVSYSPVVKPDGMYKQKVAGGQYAFSRSTITIGYKDQVFQFPLEPVGPNWNKNQDAAEGIVQNWLWKPTGATPYGQREGLDISNATHWYGMSVDISAEGYRNDIKAVPPKIPDGSKMKFTLKPTGKAIDGTEPKDALVFERVHDTSNFKAIDLNDILPGAYDMSGTVTFPDGTEKPLLLYVYQKGYLPTIKVDAQKDNMLGGLWKQPVSYVIE